jgi:hypothetical protein
MIAAGSDSGAVSLYETAAVLGGAAPKPVKEFLNVHFASPSHLTRLLTSSCAPDALGMDTEKGRLL